MDANENVCYDRRLNRLRFSFNSSPVETEVSNLLRGKIVVGYRISDGSSRTSQFLLPSSLLSCVQLPVPFSVLYAALVSQILRSECRQVEDLACHRVFSQIIESQHVTREEDEIPTQVRNLHGPPEKSGHRYATVSGCTLPSELISYNCSFIS